MKTIKKIIAVLLVFTLMFSFGLVNTINAYAQDYQVTDEIFPSSLSDIGDDTLFTTSDNMNEVWPGGGAPPPPPPPTQTGGCHWFCCLVCTISSTRPGAGLSNPGMSLCFCWPRP